MNILLCGLFYWEQPTRLAYFLFDYLLKLARIYEANGHTVKYLAKANDILPKDKTISSEKDLYTDLTSFDVVFIWNGSLDSQKELVLFCRKLDKQLRFMELGWLPQKNSLYFDHKGVGPNSSIMDWQYKLLTNDENEWLNRKLLEYHSLYTLNDIDDDDFVFVPFQVERDSQIILHSLVLKTMQSLADYVVDSVRDKIIFKTHPCESEVEVVLRDTERCKVVNSGTTHDYLRKCKYVITINSTVGLEALAHFKPVITLGRSFYGGKGITYQVDYNKENDIYVAINWANGNRQDTLKARSFLYELFKRQWNVEDLDNEQKVLDLLERQ